MDIFPSNLPGLTWNIVRAPQLATRVQKSISGRELRVADQLYPIWKWTLAYDFLRDGHDTRYGRGPGAAQDELRTIMSFYVRQLGQFSTFLFDDPSDDYITNQGLGYGDGHNTAFQLIRTMSVNPSSFTEPITQPATIVGVYVNTVSVPYSLAPYGVINLQSAPPAGALVSATFSYFWPVRFSEDTVDYTNFMYQLWELKKLQFESVLLP